MADLLSCSCHHFLFYAHSLLIHFRTHVCQMNSLYESSSGHNVCRYGIFVFLFIFADTMVDLVIDTNANMTVPHVQLHRQYCAHEY